MWVQWTGNFLDIAVGFCEVKTLLVWYYFTRVIQRHDQSNSGVL